MKYLLRSVLAIILLPISYVLLAVVVGLLPVNRSFDARADEDVEIFIRSSSIHTDFVVPIRPDSIDWPAYFPASHFRSVDPASMTHIAFGWGDRGFYIDTPTWADLKASTVVKALFLKSNSAMHVTYLHPPKPSENVKRVMLSRQQYDQLIAYIIDSFEQTSDGEFVWIEGSGYGLADTFYTAKGTYSMFKTCNDWSGKGLRSIGVKTGIWTPFPQSVIFYL